MIYHTIHTMTLDRCAEMFDTGNKRLVCRVHFVPAGYGYKRFVLAFGKLFNDNGFNKLLRDEMTQILMFNRFQTLLPSLYYILLFKSDGKDYEEACEYFKQEYGKDFGGGEDLALVLGEIKRLAKRYRMTYTEKPKQEDEGVKIGSLMATVSTVLGLPIDGRMKVSQFKNYYDLALQKIEQQNG